MKRVLLHGACLALLALFSLSATPAAAAKEGERCGGVAGTRCDMGLFCESAAGRCGVPDVAGKCEKLPASPCPKLYKPVCSCGGKTYGNDCERKMAGAPKNHDGKCETAK